MLNFTCPECRTHEIEEILQEAVVCNDRIVVEPDGSYAINGCTRVISGSVSHFQCSRCGYMLKYEGSTIRDGQTLAEYLLTTFHRQMSYEQWRAEFRPVSDRWLNAEEIMKVMSLAEPYQHQLEKFEGDVNRHIWTVITTGADRVIVPGVRVGRVGYYQAKYQVTAVARSADENQWELFVPLPAELDPDKGKGVVSDE